MHTIAAHLRQVFRKIGITSRVELTWLAIEDGQRADRGHQQGQRRDPG